MPEWIFFDKRCFIKRKQRIEVIANRYKDTTSTFKVHSIVGKTMDIFTLMKVLLLILGVTFSVNGLSEDVRLKEYEARGYVWPFPTLKPETPGWRNMFERRYRQIEEIEDSNARYNAWMQVTAASMLQPNFTENGWVYFVSNTAFYMIESLVCATFLTSLTLFVIKLIL